MVRGRRPDSREADDDCGGDDSQGWAAQMKSISEYIGRTA